MQVIHALGRISPGIKIRHLYYYYYYYFLYNCSADLVFWSVNMDMKWVLIVRVCINKFCCNYGLHLLKSVFFILANTVHYQSFLLKVLISVHVLGINFIKVDQADKRAHLIWSIQSTILKIVLIFFFMGFICVSVIQWPKKSVFCTTQSYLSGLYFMSFSSKFVKILPTVMRCPLKLSLYQ